MRTISLPSVIVLVKCAVDTDQGIRPSARANNLNYSIQSCCARRRIKLRDRARGRLCRRHKHGIEYEHHEAYERERANRSSILDTSTSGQCT